jgi:hypothetical protein
MKTLLSAMIVLALGAPAFANEHQAPAAGTPAGSEATAPGHDDHAKAAAGEHKDHHAKKGAKKGKKADKPQ